MKNKKEIKFIWAEKEEIVWSNERVRVYILVILRELFPRFMEMSEQASKTKQTSEQTLDLLR